MGFEPNLSDIQNTSLEDLTSQVATAMSQWQSGEKIKEEAAAIERSTDSDTTKTTAVLGSAAVASLAAAQPGQIVQTAQPALPVQSAQPAQVVSSLTVQTVSVEPSDYRPLSWNNTQAVSEN
jgi:hypothetical protein